MLTRTPRGLSTVPSLLRAVRTRGAGQLASRRHAQYCSRSCTRHCASVETSWLSLRSGCSAFGQRALWRPPLAPDHAPGRPKLRPASADQPSGSRASLGRTARTAYCVPRTVAPDRRRTTRSWSWTRSAWRCARRRWRATSRTSRRCSSSSRTSSTASTRCTSASDATTCWPLNPNHNPNPTAGPSTLTLTLTLTSSSAPSVAPST